MPQRFFYGLLLCLPVHLTLADTLAPIEVEGHYEAHIGEAISASEGVIGQVEIAARPLLRSGEILETIPGLVVTQHSGTGKANQYFLRGFNLDHGTDFRSVVDGMPINMRTHGHGQGYTDLNFIIPELVERIEYKKGPFYADVGDFSGAGAAQFSLASELAENLTHVGMGEDGYQRILLIKQFKSANGHSLMALEGNRYDGPWTDTREDLDKTNLFLRRVWQADDTDYHLTLMAYDNQWQSADQIPSRAVDSGLIDRLGSLDTSVGGQSSRFSVSARLLNSRWDTSLYAMKYDLDLWSNFTYFLSDPENGDQFQQVDSRTIYGLDTKRKINGRRMDQTIGLQWRTDDIGEVGLYNTVARRPFSTVRRDSVTESSVGVYWQGNTHWDDKFRTQLGLRYDAYDFDVNALRPDNSGRGSDGIASAKLNLAYALTDHWELYSGIGQGFHSNDARGVTIRVDPVSGEPVDAVDPLVRSSGAEVGLRYNPNARFNASLALWTLELDSELLFIGDAGNTEPSRASRRRGVEFTAYYRPMEGLTFDAEIAWSRSRFTEFEAEEGDRVDGSLPLVVSLGATWEKPEQWFTTARVRHFGKRTLDAFGDIESDTSTSVNLRFGKHFNQLEIGLDVLNALNSEDHDIDYLYASRLNGEVAEGVEDLHYHPLKPRTLRAYFNYRY